MPVVNVVLTSLQLKLKWIYRQEAAKSFDFCTNNGILTVLEKQVESCAGKILSINILLEIAAIISHSVKQRREIFLTMQMEMVWTSGPQSNGIHYNQIRLETPQKPEGKVVPLTNIVGTINAFHIPWSAITRQNHPIASNELVARLVPPNRDPKRATTNSTGKTANKSNPRNPKIRGRSTATAGILPEGEKAKMKNMG